ncbi:MAG: hypothetical protein LBV51_03735 [Acholeplasmatales bacterium]|jgi:hypothetical protein|nr:hypothetical protein [Acholeplasmatales bacterium]
MGKVIYPDWVTKYIERGKVVRLVNNHYYLYRVTSVYDKEKKRPKGISYYLGYITPTGLIPFDDVFVYEYGYSKVMWMKSKKLLERIINDLGDVLGNNILKQLIFRYSNKSYFKLDVTSFSEYISNYSREFEIIHDEVSQNEVFTESLKSIYLVGFRGQIALSKFSDEELTILNNLNINVKEFTNIGDIKLWN